MSSSATELTPPPLPVRLATCIALAVVVLFTFSGVLENGWIFLDDHEYVTQNPHVRAGLTWDGFKWFLHAFHVGNWHPLTSWSHMLDVELFGLSPRGPHAVNLALHTLNAVLLVHTLFLYTRRFWPSACVAAVFALHPLRVESVAWISERKDVLSGLFFVLTLLCWKRWVDRPSSARYVLVVLALSLGLASKPMLVTVPFLLLVLDDWPLARANDWRVRLVEKVPLFALSAASLVVTIVAQASSGATADLVDMTPADRASTALKAYAFYVRDTFAPRDLAPMYPYQHADGAWLPLLVLAGIAVLTAVFVRARARHPHLVTGWLWYLGMLVPVIGLLQVGSQSHADRYTYLPGIGIAIAIVFEVANLLARHPAWLVPVRVAFAAVLVSCAWLTHEQTSLWRDSRTLFEHTLRVTRDNPTAQKIYGDTLLEEGNFEGALGHYAEALRLAPQLPNGHKNLGCALAKLGRFEAAAEEFRLAAEDDPTFANYLNLGWSLGDAGRFADAIAPLTRALELDESSAPAHVRLGMSLGESKRMEEAIQQFKRALELSPTDLEARRALAMAERARGNAGAALAEYGRLLEQSPDDVEVLVNVARIRSTHPDSRLRDGAEAVRCAERARAVAASPFSFLFGALASAYAEVGRFDEAVKAAARAVELARAEGDAAAAARYESELAEHRAGRPFRTQ